MTSTGSAGKSEKRKGSVESWLVSAGRDRRPGSPRNVPPIPASSFVLADQLHKERPQRIDFFFAHSCIINQGTHVDLPLVLFSTHFVNPGA